MPIDSPLFPFTAWAIAGAPTDPGVYALWSGDELIYLGRAQGADVTIRSRLWEHYTHNAEPHDATHYNWELSRSAAQREAELLHEFSEKFQRLPRGNRKA